MPELSPREARRRFIRNLRRQLERRGIQRDEHVENVLGTLTQLQQQVLNTLEFQPTEFEAARLPELLREIDEAVDRWTRRARGETSSAIEAAWELGPEILDGPLAAAEIAVPRTILPGSLLDEFQSTALDLIDDLGPLTKRRIGDTLRLSLLGGQGSHEAMKAIGTRLSDPGPFKFIRFRAETIYRTEMGRVHSAAGQRRQEAATELLPDLGKQWHWSGKSRVSHQLVHGQVRPVKQPFDVAGEQLMYPRDPAGSAGNTINCGCESVPHMARWS